MKILVKVSTYDEFDDGGINCLLLELDENAKKSILARRELLQMVKSKDAGLAEFSFWGIPGGFHNLDDEELLGDDDFKVMEDGFNLDEEVCCAECGGKVVNDKSPGFVLHVLDDGEIDHDTDRDHVARVDEEEDPIRTEIEQMVITENGFYFTAGIKHSSVSVESREIPYEVLLRPER